MKPFLEYCRIKVNELGMLVRYCRICNNRDLEYMTVPLGTSGMYIYRKYCKNCQCEFTIKRWRHTR